MEDDEDEDDVGELDEMGVVAETAATAAAAIREGLKLFVVAIIPALAAPAGFQIDEDITPFCPPVTLGSMYELNCRYG